MIPGEQNVGLFDRRGVISRLAPDFCLMAQDFRAAFGLGDDDNSISALNSDGVMYAAIQGLVEELKERDKAIEELKSELRTIREQLSNLTPAP